jgi:magnesium chelatase family protein
VRERVARARARQQARQGHPNARLLPSELDRYCAPDADGEALLVRAMARLTLSARAYHRVLKVARTIADLEDSDGVAAAHVAEALQLRCRDRPS